MTILITGSTAKTSTRIADLLQAENLPVIIATRRSPDEIPYPSVNFDWFDPSTYTNPFPQGHDVSAVYLVSSDVAEPATHVNAFIDAAFTAGVKRFVLCAGSSAQKGGPYLGPVWAQLDDIGAEYAVLKPTWFMENFSEWQHSRTIREESVFYSAAEDGRMPFVTAEDIAAAAAALLSGKVPCGNTGYFILGPELLTHDQVAEILSDVLGRRIRHVRKSQEEMVVQYTKVGVKPAMANLLPFLEGISRDGSEEKYENDLERVIGRKGVSFRDWAERQAKKGLFR